MGMGGNELKKELRELRRSLQAIPEAREPPKPTLRILGSARAEQYWNRLLWYFLNPDQPHGFGADLLTSFLDKLAQQTTADVEYIHRHIDRVKVGMEVSSPNDNRPDLVIRSPSNWFVCIECKVDAGETNDQLTRYIQDPYIGNELKSTYPEAGHHYVYLSKTTASDANTELHLTKETAPTSFVDDYLSANSTADEYHKRFVDLSWGHVVDAFTDVVRFSRGQYPDRSVSQLDDFHANINKVTSMTDDDFTERQKEKMQFLDEYRSEIDELFEAAEALRRPLAEDGEWVDMFRSVAPDCEVWTDEWHCRRDKWGCIFQSGWYRDNNWEPTTDHQETRGGSGHRLHFTHMIRKERSFRDGVLKFELRSSTNNSVRSVFNNLYNSERWQTKLDSVCDEHGITNKGNQKTYTTATYDVNQAGLPESYFETLETAFSDHQELAHLVNQIHREAVAEARPSDGDT
ncbi:PD-(D/E)XK nuclease family protein [Haloarchaeobius sp. FL176]|uniref:PD-(D/E)XK nuclease family protein n=1 Tax=Haloarchaeobius sp. FL176 TaxID=2967129 RepID=UPI002148133C|nr:PD-(D/E)XK nuclease family protein [Haloarchaeobius sp. FL176]